VLQKYRSTDSCCKSLYSYVHDGLFKKRILLFIHGCQLNIITAYIVDTIFNYLASVLIPNSF